MVSAFVDEAEESTYNYRIHSDDSPCSGGTQVSLHLTIYIECLLCSRCCAVMGPEIKEAHDLPSRTLLSSAGDDL